MINKDRCGEWSPAITGISGINLKTQAATAGNIIDFRGFNTLTFVLNVVDVGTAATGASQLELDLYAADGVTLVASAVRVATWSLTTGGDVTGALTCTVDATQITVSASGGFTTPSVTVPATNAGLGPFMKIKPRLNVTAASAAVTSATGSLWIFGM